MKSAQRPQMSSPAAGRAGLNAAQRILGCMAAEAAAAASGSVGALPLVSSGWGHWRLQQQPWNQGRHRRQICPAFRYGDRSLRRFPCPAPSCPCPSLPLPPLSLSLSLPLPLPLALSLSVPLSLSLFLPSRSEPLSPFHSEHSSLPHLPRLVPFAGPRSTQEQLSSTRIRRHPLAPQPTGERPSTVHPSFISSSRRTTGCVNGQGTCDRSSSKDKSFLSRGIRL